MEKNKPIEIFTQFKKWYNSSTIISIIIMVIPQLLKMFNIEVDLIQIGNDINNTVDIINISYNDVITLIASISAIWGRLKAGKKLN